MRHGLYLANQGPFGDVGLLADLAADAEANDWDGFFIWDEMLPIWSHVGRLQREADAGVDWSGVVDTYTALAVIAARTRRIRFGALVTPVSRLRPEVFAQQTATIDRLSGGRLILGIGLGNPDDQFRSFGHETEPRARAALVDEFLEVLARLWTGEPVDFRGRFYTADAVALTPTPAQKSRIPIWIGGDSGARAPLRRAARWDGFCPASTGWPDEIIPASDYRVMAERIGADRMADGPFDLVLIGNADGTAPRASELDDYSAAGVTWTLAQAFSVDDARARISGGPPG